jgi:GTP-binding protein HflX
LDLDVETPVDNGRLLSYLAAHGEVLSRRYHDSQVVVHCRLSPRHLGRLHDDRAVIRPHSNGNGAHNGEAIGISISNENGESR